MFKVGNIEIDKAISLAPMEDISDVSFRLVCKELGADLVYTEFVNAEGLIRKVKKTRKKLELIPEERPVAIQIYGANLNSMVEAAKIAEAENPDFIDINAGCWVKNIVGAGAGAGLLKNPEYLREIVSSVVKAVKLPVTVKTRIGWDANTIHILEIAKMLEDVGVAALVVHCRTRMQGHSGDADWSWIPRIKEVVNIPVGLNGNVMCAQDVKRAFEETGADSVMIARGAIGQPWIFKEAKELMTDGKISTIIDKNLMITTCLRHLKLAIEVKTEKRAVLEHRKFYSGYLKGLFNASEYRQKLMYINEYSGVEELLLQYLDFLEKRDEEHFNTGEHTYIND